MESCEFHENYRALDGKTFLNEYPVLYTQDFNTCTCLAGD